MTKKIDPKRCLVGSLLLSLLSPLALANRALPLTPTAWKQESFAGHTQYEKRSIDGTDALCGQADASASALLYEQDVDLSKTPYLKWQWKIIQALPSADETSKQTDDFAARVYVLHSSGFWKFGLRALNYVWSSSAPIGQSWPNPYAGKRAMMLPLRSGPPEQNWVAESRDLAADFQKHVQREIDEVHGVAIMIDSDNTGGKASACIRNLHFSATP